MSAGSDILERIIRRKRGELATAQEQRPLWVVEQGAISRGTPLDFAAALRGPVVSLIAEVKHASPSRGILIDPFDPVVIARDYLYGGAAAISVLTDRTFFQGSLDDLTNVKRLTRTLQRDVPVLRKDFTIDAYQIIEARAAGADAILLIVAALDDATLAVLHAEAQRWNLTALVEVHDEAELERAAAVGATVIGINNRDLRTFTVDLATTERLAARKPAGALLVSESGIHTRADVERLAACGVDAMLVGESLIVAPDRRAAARALLGLAPPKAHARPARTGLAEGEGEADE
ncbi:MAG: indole-3-glycerol phosphate synthase TrpC [Chloroflexi bacterium]|nr:indole-3-glycerol phosphate synthase TrpC [Chloroflexota bacterium]